MVRPVRPVSILGVGMTRFGILEDSLVDLAVTTAFEAMGAPPISPKDIDHLFVGCQNPDEFTQRGHISTLLSDRLGLVPAGATRVESGPSSGASAFEAGYNMVAAGTAEVTLVVGVEKMSEVERGQASRILAKMMSLEEETRYGATPTALAALIARRYMYDYGLTRDELSMIPVKAHRNGANNPLAHFQKEITLEKVRSSQIVADPLTLYDCCPTSDGAAAVIIASGQFVKKMGFQNEAIPIMGIGHATDYLAVQHRQSLTSMTATVRAAGQAYRMAEIEPKDIDVCEVHDAFSILELVNMEDLGLAPRGAAMDLVRDGDTEVTGKIPVNPSGGIKARGHPTGATGVAQIRDVVLQLRNKAPSGIQTESPQIGLTHNIGGFGNNNIVTILGRP